MSPSIERLNRILDRVNAIAAEVPMIVAREVAISPTIKLVRSEPISSVSFHASPYQRHVKPCQMVLNREVLNESVTSTTIGA